MGRVIQGFCLRPHSETHGKSQIDKVWKPKHLREAATTLADSPVTMGASKQAGAVVGRVKYSEYVDEKGVRYEAELFDDEAIQKVEAGMVEPAPRMIHESPDMNKQEEPIVITEIEFDSLFLTPHLPDAVPKLGRPGIDRNI